MTGARPPHAAGPAVTVIGIGNPYRRDDGAAGAVLARLRERWGDDPRVRLVELDGESVRVMQAWEGSPVVWIVDAVRSGRPPGTVHEVDARCLADLDDTGARLGGGHLMGLADSVELARALDRLPAELHVLGIEGDDFADGEGLSAGAAAGVAQAVEVLVHVLAGVVGDARPSADAGEQFAEG